MVTATDHPPPRPHSSPSRPVSAALFAELEELARVVDITYCVGLGSLGISKPFTCLSRCTDFPLFELITEWNTGPLLSDSCGYIALDHDKERVIVAFRGTYSVANTVADLSTIPQEYEPYPGAGKDEKLSEGKHISEKILEGVIGKSKRNDGPASEPQCKNCTVHMGFHRSWTNTRSAIMQDLEQQLSLYPTYALHLVGHSLGGAVATLAALDLRAQGLNPTVTTFGSPRIGNAALATYITQRFDLNNKSENSSDLKFRRITHIDDPVPLLPLTEWGYTAHAGEIYISKPALSPEIQDLRHCEGEHDARCIAGQDPTVLVADTDNDNPSDVQKRDLVSLVRTEAQEVMSEPWGGIPSRYKLWQLFFAHRDYFWRLGLCMPGGDPLGGGGDVA
ncbi:hypothetical protein B0A50_08766 [Salinomyces thailandicus]|uniref:Fungal lipase-type domain-containing protein n=1 Tax=Salinomyces thailandicus TaxID=706561 RepID=A0A4U0TIX2_9PEZI|nr:hypothetical protein B0A50_08766 [Salinomyces thailandica]